MKPLVYVIVGPTSSGKSAFAVELARKIGGEVISADSRQVYRGLNIGSGKITKKEMRGIPHHMLDVVDPKKVFTAHDYARLARPILEDIIARGRIPIICGGTGFYIDALLGRTYLPDVPPNPALRKRLARESAPELFTMLEKKDPRRAASIDRNNPVRLVRALEIVAALGSVPPVSPRLLDARIKWIGIRRADGDLKRRIRARLHARMRSGMVAEVKRLHARGLSFKRMEDLGLEYRHLSRFVRGFLSRGEMLGLLESEICNYARRQMTYWRRNPSIRWVWPRL